MTRWFVDTYERAILWLLVIQFFFVNIIFTTYTQNIVILKDLTSPLFSILILGLWVCGDLARTGRWFLPRHGVVPAMVVALLFWETSVFAGSSTAYGLEVWGRMFCYFVQTWAIIRFVNSIDRMKLLLRCFLVTNIPLILYGLTQIMGADLLVDLGLIPDWGASVFVSTHGNQNFYAGYLITTFPALIGYWLVTQSPVLIMGLPILILLNIHQVVYSTARGAYLGMTAFFPLFLLAMLANRKNLHIVEDVLRKRLFQFVAIVLVIGVLIGGVLAFDRAKSFVEGIYREYYSLVDFESTYVNAVRLIFFQMAADSALRHPWFGRGIGSFNWNMPETRYPAYHRSGVSHNTDHPHDEHLEWLHDTGLFGLAMFWWILAAYFWTGVREIRRHRKGYYFPLVLAAFGGPWMLWIQASFDVETRWTGNNVTLWTTVGFVLAFHNLPIILKREELGEAKADIPAVRTTTGRRRGAARPTPLQPELNPSPYLPYVAACFVLITLFYCVEARDHWKADHHLRNNMMHTEGGGGNIQEAIKEAEMAEKLAYTITSNYYKLAYSYLVAGRLEDALVSYRDLQSFAPNYAQIHINLAFLNDQLGYRIASAAERDRAALIEHNARNHRDAAQHWLQMGSPKRAIAHLRQCLTLTTDRTASVFSIMWNEFDSIYADLARIYLSLGDTKQALFALEKALRFNPSNRSAGLLLAELQNQPDKREAVAQLLELVTERSPDNPALLIFSMEQAIEGRRYADALSTAAKAATILSLPPAGGQPDQEMVGFGNSLLQGLQKIFAANHDQAHCFAIAGWIYACQGRYPEAEQFLGQAYGALRDPLIAEQLGAVRARAGN